MYYKIENKECEVYKKLHELRTKELQLDEENLKLIKNKIEHEFENALGSFSQQSFYRVKRYVGFEFLNPENVDLKVWKRHKEFNKIFIPNRKTAKGKELASFLDQLETSYFERVFTILSIELNLSKIVYPFVEIVGDVLIIFLGNDQEPENPNVIEITKTEFESIRKKLISE